MEYYLELSLLPADEHLAEIALTCAIPEQNLGSYLLGLSEMFTVTIQHMEHRPAQEETRQ